MSPHLQLASAQPYNQLLIKARHLVGKIAIRNARQSSSLTLVFQIPCE